MIFCAAVTLTTLTLSLALIGCNTQPPSNKNIQSAQAAPPEETGASADTGKVSFSITKVEVTKKAQKMGSGNTIAFSGNELKPTIGTPKTGYVFVIVTFSVGVPGDKLAYDPRTDFVLSGSTAVYSEVLQKDVWMQYNSSDYGKGNHESRRLYLIASDRVSKATVHFLGSDYPIESFLVRSTGR